MPALTDPKLEAFAQALLLRLAEGLTSGKAATQAAKDAGYGGSSLGPNARKRAQRKDVKARVVELAAPIQAAIESEISETLEAVTTNLFRMALKRFDTADIKPSDALKASELLAKIRGWNAPEKHEHDLNGLGDRLDRAFAAAQQA